MDKTKEKTPIEVFAATMVCYLERESDMVWAPKTIERILGWTIKWSECEIVKSGELRWFRVALGNCNDEVQRVNEEASDIERDLNDARRDLVELKKAAVRCRQADRRYEDCLSVGPELKAAGSALSDAWDRLMQLACPSPILEGD